MRKEPVSGSMGQVNRQGPLEHQAELKLELEGRQNRSDINQWQVTCFGATLLHCQTKEREEGCAKLICIYLEWKGSEQ